MPSRRAFLASLSTAAVAATTDAKKAAQMAHDWRRPQYHFLPAANWMNDPNGPIYHKGQYHLFYQYNPNGAFWGTMHWGHAVSPDMLRWKHLPVALAPDPNGPDRDGVFSGSALILNGTPTIIYTGVKPETQCVATSDDQMIRWKKHPANPIIAGPRPDLKAAGFRDPCVWKEKDGWYLALGSGVRGTGGMVLLYRSSDFVHWTYLHPLFEGKADPQKLSEKDPVGSGEMWECPDFFPLGNRHVLLISTMGKVYWYVGKYADQKFTPEANGHVDYGAYYAAKSFLDKQNNRVLWGWLPERRSKEEQMEAGWSGVMSLPRVLTLGKNNQLLMEPVKGLESLRGDVLRMKPRLVAGDVPVPNVSGTDCAEFLAEFAPGTAQEFGLVLSWSQNPIEIAVSPQRNQLRINQQTGEFRAASGEPVRLRVFRDGSVIELFVNNRSCLTAREYQPGLEDLSVFARGGNVMLRSLEAYPITPISPDRLTTG